jgi:hypothetical protein
MYIPFESLPSSSRIWIFQSNRPFTAKEVELLTARLRTFTDEWNVHGMPLNTSFKVSHNQFIILAADESQQSASGCSIDSSVRTLKEIEQSLGLELFDRNLVAFKKENTVLTIPLSQLKENFASGILEEGTLTFYNLVNTKAQLENDWLVPAKATWLKRYISNPLAKVN